MQNYVPPTNVIYLFIAMPHGMWDLGSLTRDQTQAPSSGSGES